MRHQQAKNTIALLATGDEISQGDILNTNSQEIAYRLSKHGMNVGMHMVANDHIVTIESAIRFLLTHHQALIIIGGLGPTSDDLTRYALGNALQKTLLFDTATWEYIVKRLQHLGYQQPPEGNRQQALFPEGATVIPNPHGTAAGCFLHQQQQLIFMLPGPPIECLPMVDNTVLPTLMEHGYSHVQHRQAWLLFGVSEGHIAEKLDALTKPYDCTTGYRLAYPYVEFKLHSNNLADFNTVIDAIQQTIAPYLVEDGKQIASLLLQQKIIKHRYSLEINDLATGGSLEASLKTPDTYPYVKFTEKLDRSAMHMQLIIKGLDSFWQKENSNKTHLEMLFHYQGKQQTIKKEIPLRGIRVKQYAVEFICREILKEYTKPITLLE